MPPNAVSPHPHVRPIIFTHSYLTVDHHAPWSRACHTIVFWTLKSYRLETCLHYTMKPKIYSRSLHPLLWKTHKKSESPQRQASDLNGILFLQSLYTGVTGTAMTWRGLCSIRLSAIFRVRKITFAHRQRLDKEGEIDAHSLTLGLATCTHSCS